MTSDHLGRRGPDEATDRWRPRTPHIACGLRKVFVTAAFAMTAAFGVGTVMMSLGAQIARDLLGSDNALVTGAILALFAVVVGAVAILAKGAPANTFLGLGSASTTLGMALLAMSAAESSLSIFLAASVAMGGGYSLLFLGGLALISANAPARHRAGTLSAAYLMQGVTALLLGALATVWGLRDALDLGAPAIAILSLAASVSIGRYRPQPAGPPPNILGTTSEPTRPLALINE